LAIAWRTIENNLTPLRSQLQEILENEAENL
jgi:hypothetical protein